MRVSELGSEKQVLRCYWKLYFSVIFFYIKQELEHQVNKNYNNIIKKGSYFNNIKSHNIYENYDFLSSASKNFLTK